VSPGSQVIQQMQQQVQQQQQQQQQVLQMLQMPQMPSTSPLIRADVPKLKMERAKCLVKRFKELGFNVNSGRINGIHQTRDMLVAQLYHAAWPEHIDVMLDVPEKY
jgi:hypothetical protein